MATIANVPQRKTAALAQLLQQAFVALHAGEAERVEALCLQILAHDVHHADALFVLGLSGRMRGRWEMAVNMMRRAIRSNPNVPLYHTNLGVTLQKLQQDDEAENCFRLALKMQPDQPEALCALGSLLCGRNENESAIGMLRRAVDQVPDYSAAWNNLGIALKQAGRVEEALPCLKKALHLNPQDQTLRINLGEVLDEANHFDEAVREVKQVLDAEPENVKAKQLLSYACYHAGRPEEAIHFCEQALKYRPDHAPTLLNLAMMHLLMGDYPRGFAEYEVRYQVMACSTPEGPVWQGEDLSGKRILLTSEQGMGDMIQFLRYVDQVVATGAEVMVQLPERLVRLAQGIPGVSRWLKTGDALPEYDFHASLFSLPLRFGTTVETIPGRVPYLTIPEDARKKAAALNWPQDGLKVGFNWTGSPTHRVNRLRSIPLAMLEPLFDLPNLHLYSLQMGPGAAELAPYAERIHDLAPDTEDMADTAAQMEHLDLVITIDTSIAHVAGALGRPLWILLNTVPDWRWMTGRSDSPWYPTARLIRQRQQGEWCAVVKELRRGLQHLLAHSSR